MANPYRSLPPSAFWKKAVSEKSLFDISDLYTKKFTIEPTDRLVTAGSCFAQHIAKKLSASGYFNKHIFNFLNDCASCGVDVVVVSSPYVPAAYYNSEADRPLPEAEYYEVDRQFRLVVAAELDAMGIDVILPPVECFSDGFLLPQFCRDPDGDYHGNNAYGLIVARQIIDFDSAGTSNGLAPMKRSPVPVR